MAKVKNLKDVAMEGIDWTEELARRKAASNTVNAAHKSLDQFIQYAHNAGYLAWAKFAEELRDQSVVPERNRLRQLVDDAHANKK